MHPRLPYWYHIGRAATPVKGDVYVIRDNGSVVHTPGPAILTPRMKFFASQQTVSSLVAKKLVKRLAQPKEPKPAAPEEVAVPDSKSEDGEVLEPARLEEPETEQEPEAKDEAEQVDDVIASDAGEAEDSLSEPEENQENRSSRRRKKLRRE